MPVFTTDAVRNRPITTDAVPYRAITTVFVTTAAAVFNMQRYTPLCNGSKSTGTL